MTLNSSTQKYESVPISLGDSTDQLYLLLFGTGFRDRTALTAVNATVGGTAATVYYAGSQGAFVGLDQANVLIPRILAGRGEVNVVPTVDGNASNTVTINVQ